MRVAIGLVSLAAALLLAGSSRATQGIWLVAPENDAVLAPGQAVTFTFGTDWLTGMFPGALELQVARDAGFETTVADEMLTCPASFQPSCPDSSTQGPFEPGAYFWRIRWYERPESGPSVWVPSDARVFRVGDMADAPSGNVTPKAAIVFEPAHPQPGELLRFDGSESRDPDGSIVSYTWSFGNGNGAGGSPSVGAAYDTPGTFIVTLIVTDDRGATDTATVSVAVGTQPAVETTTTTETVTTSPETRAGPVVVTDTTPPTVAALAGTARPGTLVRIWFRVHDDSGRAAVETTLRFGRKVIAKLKSPRGTKNGLRYVVWRAPRAPSRLTFCVQARDASSNVSAVSCAPLRIR
jgi:hypothetical protein